MHMENILAKVAETGAKVNRMKLVVNRLEDDYLNFNKLLFSERGRGHGGGNHPA